MSDTYTLVITEENFQEEVLKSTEPVLLDFWAPWCGPCRTIAPALDELAEEYAGKVKVGKVNVDEQTALATAFQVRGIPALYALKDGEVVDKMVGWGGKQRLRDAFTKLASTADEQGAA